MTDSQAVFVSPQQSLPSAAHPDADRRHTAERRYWHLLEDQFTSRLKVTGRKANTHKYEEEAD